MRLVELAETTVVRLIKLVLRTDVDCANLESLVGGFQKCASHAWMVNAYDRWRK